MVTISRHRSGSTGRKQMALVYLLIGAIFLFCFNAFNVPDDNDSHMNLRVVPKRKLDDDGSIELDIDNAILTDAVVKENAEQLTTTAALDINRIDAEKSSSATPTGSPTEKKEAITTTTTATTATTTTTAATAATTIPIRDMIHKRSLEVKQLLLDQFSGSNNSPPNPLYHQSLQGKKMTTMNISCAQDDAFSGIPVDDGKHHAWVPSPPGGYSREALAKWEKAFNGAMNRIREEASGGDTLREFAETEVKQLRKLRHSLFCKRE
mmetsp:Transcript_28165/g.56651  ORF Transcript_28165/g.56651 Transcript_28165/m.56651 type:complete len:265 (+) Transcript_28165:4520-5314(+)